MTKRARRKLPRSQREKQMLDAAARVFAVRGFHRASMDEIARRVGVTKPMLYAYFDSKEKLYLATVDRAGRYLVSAIEALLGEPDPLKRLREGAQLLLQFIDRDRHGWAVLFAEGLGGGTVARHVAGYRNQIAQAAAITLAGLRAGGTVDAAAVRGAEPYAVGLLAAGEAMARWWVSHPEVPLKRISEITGDLVEAVLSVYRERV